MRYYAAVGDEADPVLVSLERMEAQLKRMEKARRFALWATIAGAVFAAGRLGVLAVPFVRQRR